MVFRHGQRVDHGTRRVDRGGECLRHIGFDVVEGLVEGDGVWVAGDDEVGDDEGGGGGEGGAGSAGVAGDWVGGGAGGILEGEGGCVGCLLGGAAGRFDDGGCGHGSGGGDFDLAAGFCFGDVDSLGEDGTYESGGEEGVGDGSFGDLLFEEHGCRYAGENASDGDGAGVVCGVVHLEGGHGPGGGAGVKAAGGETIGAVGGHDFVGRGGERVHVGFSAESFFDGGEHDFESADGFGDDFLFGDAEHLRFVPGAEVAGGEVALLAELDDFGRGGEGWFGALHGDEGAGRGWWLVGLVRLRGGGGSRFWCKDVVEDADGFHVFVMSIISRESCPGRLYWGLAGGGFTGTANK